MNKHLQIIQKLAKIGKIVCMVVFVTAIVSFVLAGVGIVLLALGFTSLDWNGFSIRGLIETEVGMSVAESCTRVGMSMVALVALAVMAWFARDFFKKQLADGTPFTAEGAKRSTRLGIILIVTDFVASLGEALVNVIMNLSAGVKMLPTLESGSSLVIGVAFLIFAVIIRYVVSTAPTNATPSAQA